MKILVSGLVNLETNVPVNTFPIAYDPIHYQFGLQHTVVSGVGFNVAKALYTLGAKVVLTSIIGEDRIGKMIADVIRDLNMSTEYLYPMMSHTAQSTVLYQVDGKRMIYCDLKNLQQLRIPVNQALLNALLDSDLIVATNIQFSKEILKKAKQLHKRIACDVHLLSHLEDPYNQEFMELADILFYSAEGQNHPLFFLKNMSERYQAEIIVATQGKDGLLCYERHTKKIHRINALFNPTVVNTVGAGDALFSAFCYFYLHENNVQIALKKATFFASYKVGFSGGSEGFLTQTQLEQMMKDF